MSLLSIEKPEFTPEQYFLATVSESLSDFHEYLIVKYNQIMRMFWSEDCFPSLSTQERFDIIGAQSQTLFFEATNIKETILRNKPEDISKLVQVPEKYSWAGGIIFNQDGTVTVTAQE